MDAGDATFVIFTDQRLAPRDAIADIGSSEHVNGLTTSDSDGDGLSDADESAAGYDTDAHNSDTDGDGMPDGWEVANGFDPKVKNTDRDKDRDGKTDLEEYQLGTNPCVFDLIRIHVELSPVPTVVLDNPTDRNFRLLRWDPASGQSYPVSEWKDFGSLLSDPDPDPLLNSFQDPGAGSAAVWWLEGSPNYPPPP